ncbi:MAG: PAS domain-containing protein [Victivallaceae bacterium]|nr:PAS domain-containing protein [Victivallaceae bacterium]
METAIIGGLVFAIGFMAGAAGVAIAVVLRKKRKESLRAADVTALNTACVEVLSASGDGVVSMDAGGRVLSLNPAAEKLVGVKSVEAAGRHYSEIVRMVEAEDGSTPFDPLAGGGDAGKAVIARRNFRIMMPDGKSWNITDRVMALFSRGRFPRMFIVMHDAGENLTQQHRLQEALDNSNELNNKLNSLITEYEMLLDTMPVYFYIEDAENGFKHVKCNRLCSTLWGIPVDEIIGKSDEELFGNAEEVKKFRETDIIAMQTDGVYEDVLPFTDKAGNRRVGHFYRRGVTMPDGHRQLFGLVVDITEEQYQRGRLDAVMNAFEYAFDMTHTAVFRLDIETHEMFGAKNLNTLWPIHNGIGAVWTEVVYPEDIEKFAAEQADLLSGRIEKMNVNYRSTCFGELKYYRMEAGLARITGGKTTIVGIIQDVTCDKKRELEYNAALQQQNSILNAILSSIPSQVFIKDVNDGFRYKLANRNFTEYYRMNKDDVIGHTDYEIFPSTVAQQLRDHDLKVCSSTGTAFRFDEDISYCQSGNEIFKSLKVCFETGDHNKYLLGVCVDVTELECAKKQAEETAEWLRLTLNSIGDGVLTTDLDGNVSMMNPVAERMTGIPLKQAKGQPHERVFRIVSSVDDEPMASPLTRAIRTGNVVELANHTDLIGANGERYHIADSAAPIFNAGHEIIGAILVFRDVTDEYLRRDMLRAAMAQLELGAEMTRVATFRVEPETRRISGSRLLPELWPLNGDIAEKPENWVFQDDLKEFMDVVYSLSDGESGTRSCVYRAGAAGAVRQYQISMIPDRMNGRVNDIVGAIQDVTEIRENAAKLKATQELWELVINSIPIMLFAKDADDGFRYAVCNQAFAEFLGKTPAEVIGRTDAELFELPGEIEQYASKDRLVMASDAGDRFEEVSTDFRGMKHFIRSFKRPITGVGNRNLLLGVCVDITEMHNLLQYEHVSNTLLTYAVSVPDFAPLVEKVLGTVLASLKCDRVIFAVIGEDGQLHRYRDIYSDRCLPLENIGVDVHEGLWNVQLDRFKNGEFVAYEKFSDIPGSEKLLAINPAYPIRSAAGVPVFAGRDFVGVLFVSFTEHHTIEIFDDRFMHAVAGMIALAQIREIQRQAVKRAEERNQTILDNLNIPIWLYDLNGAVVQTNNASEQLFPGVMSNPSPYACRGILDCRKSDDECPVRQCIVGGKAQQCDYEHINGHSFIAETRPIFDGDGKMINVVKSFFDITTLRAMIGNRQMVNECLANLLREKDIMRALELSLKSICEHADVDRCVIMRFNPERRTLSSFIEVARSGVPPSLGDCHEQPYSVEPSWEERFRRQPILAIPDLPGSIDAEGLTSWKTVIDNYDLRSFYAHRIKFDGRIWGYIGIIYEKRRKVLTPESLDLFGSLASCVELTLDRRKNQQEVLAALEKAKAADRAKSLFLASMSHEIRTPLNAVIGFSELLKDGSLPPDERQDYLANITTAGNALLLLINDVLDLSKLEAGQMVLTPEPVDFPALVREVGGIFKQKCAERGISLVLDVPGDMPTIWLAKLRIRQVLFNLLGNAVKFTDHGGVTVKAEFLRKSDTVGDFSFHVIDTGCGIAPEDQKKLFQLFVQASALRGTKTANNGTGLGLAICRRLIEQMNGGITLSSEPERGSDFLVTLHDVRYDMARRPAATPPEAGAACMDFGGEFTALLVDDVRMNLKVMAAMLNKLGVRSLQASNGNEALELLENNRIDFVLTDMWMPGLNGAELAARIRKNKKTADLPVFAVTADIEANENFSVDAFSGMLLKPVTGEKLRKLVASFAARRTVARQ